MIEIHKLFTGLQNFPSTPAGAMTKIEQFEYLCTIVYNCLKYGSFTIGTTKAKEKRDTEEQKKQEQQAREREVERIRVEELERAKKLREEREEQQRQEDERRILAEEKILEDEKILKREKTLTKLQAAIKGRNVREKNKKK